jgi:hypothetical protein
MMLVQSNTELGEGLCRGHSVSCLLGSSHPMEGAALWVERSEGPTQ